MKRKLLFVGVIVAVAVASAATYAFATSTADAVIHACVAKDGNVRIVAVADACKNNEAALEWSQQGPAGAQGAQGAQGSPGSAGSQGAAGRDGRDGAQGASGPAGGSGPAGPAGPAGAQGPAGPSGAAAAAAASPNAIDATASIVGQHQGAFAGDGRGGKIDVIAVSHEIVSPRDPQSGLPTGQRLHKPFVITKQLDKATPLLYNALDTNENLTSATFTYYRSGSAFMTVKLTNANIASISQSGGTETISFTYQKIEWTWADGGITAQADWLASTSP